MKKLLLGTELEAGHRARCGAKGWTPVLRMLRHEEKGFRAAQLLQRFCLYKQDKATKEGQVTVASELGTREQSQVARECLADENAQTVSRYYWSVVPSNFSFFFFVPDFCNEPIPLASLPALSSYYLFVNYLLD